MLNAAEESLVLRLCVLAHKYDERQRLKPVKNGDKKARRRGVSITSLTSDREQQEQLQEKYDRYHKRKNDRRRKKNRQIARKWSREEKEEERTYTLKAPSDDDVGDDVGDDEASNGEEVVIYLDPMRVFISLLVGATDCQYTDDQLVKKYIEYGNILVPVEKASQSADSWRLAEDCDARRRRKRKGQLSHYLTTSLDNDVVNSDTEEQDGVSQLDRADEQAIEYHRWRPFKGGRRSSISSDGWTS